MERAVDELLRHSENIVAVSRNPLNYKIDEVVCDGKKIARDAIDYLISLGHRNIAYVGDCHKEARFKGYQETLFRYNISYEPDYIVKCKISEEDGIQAIKELIELENPPTAIYCANDIIAIGMLKYLSMGHNRYYRPSIISSLLRAESAAANAIFPHKIFEIGKVAFLDELYLASSEDVANNV